MRARQEGFTLIELLVVIAIIGILAAIILASLAAAKTKGSDAQRIEDVKSLETAMELYYDLNGSYPSTCTGGAADTGIAISALASCLVPTEIGSIPSTLESDGDEYAWDSTYGYGLYIYIAANVSVNSGFCRTGQNVNPGWWHSPPTCSF